MYNVSCITNIRYGKCALQSKECILYFRFITFVKHSVVCTVTGYSIVQEY